MTENAGIDVTRIARLRMIAQIFLVLCFTLEYLLQFLPWVLSCRLSDGLTRNGQAFPRSPDGRSGLDR